VSGWRDSSTNEADNDVNIAANNNREGNENNESATLTECQVLSMPGNADTR
jgi:hypothetical protein